MWIEILLLLISIFALIYWSITKNYTHWKKFGVPQAEPSFPFGNWGPILLGKMQGRELFLKSYKQFKSEPFYGTYLMSKPILMIKDPEVLRNILVKDFDHFVDRSNLNDSFNKDNKVDVVWMKQLPSLTGDEWKEARSTFSPIFTSGKLKSMMGLIEKVTEDLVKEIDKKAKADEMFECKEILGKFSMDTIATCAFGLDAQSFRKEDSEFVRMAKNVFTKTRASRLKVFIRLLPYGLGKKLLNLFGATAMGSPEPTLFFVKVIEETLEARKSLDRTERRNDMVDIMLDLMEDNIDKNDIEDYHKNDQFEADAELTLNRSSKTKLDDIMIIATAMIVLIAGYDTTAQTLAYCCYRLAINPEIQRKLQDEIDDAFERSNGELPSYQVIQGLSYLDMVLSETSRMHPALDVLSRICSKDYKIPNSEVVIKKGETVHINVIGIHYDDKYYHNPEVFDPEHFSKENKAKRSPYAFLTFGQGPRSCIGMRFALLEAKMALASILHKFTLVPCEKTVDKVVLDPNKMLGGNVGGLWIKAKARY